MAGVSLLPLRRNFLLRLAAARFLAYPLFRGIHPRSSLSGPPTDFEGHRPYIPGDDTRWIDWSLYARLEELYVKVFHVEEEVEVLIFVDGSRSMTSPSDRKYQLAAAAGAALFYLAIHTSHPATVVRYAERTLDSRGPYRFFEGHTAVNKLLLTPSTGNGTDLHHSLLPHLLKRRRPVTVVALSDGFQKDPVERVADAFGSFPDCRFVFIRILDSDDLRPRLRGRISLRDLESESNQEIISDRALEKQLHHRIATYFERLEANLHRRGWTSLVLSVDERFENAFLRMLAGAVPAPAGLQER